MNTLKHFQVYFIILAITLFFSGCGGGSDSSGTEDTTDDTTTATTGTQLALTDDNNYIFDGSLYIQSYQLADLSDPLIDWSGVTSNLQGDDISASDDIDYSALSVWNSNLTEEDVENGLSTNTLTQSDIAAYLSFDTEGATSVNMSEYTLALVGTDVDIEDEFYEDSGWGLFMVTIASGSTLGAGTQMAAFLIPDATSTDTTLALSNDSSVLDLTVDLESLAEVVLSPGTSDYTVDWSNLTLKGDGSDFSSSDVDEVMIAHYENLSLSDLEDQFLDIDEIADEIWTADVTSGTSVALEDFTSTGDGSAFEGIDDTGTWILALICSECANPAPPFLTVLTAE